jgi:hypothetical protein
MFRFHTSGAVLMGTWLCTTTSCYLYAAGGPCSSGSCVAVSNYRQCDGQFGWNKFGFTTDAACHNSQAACLEGASTDGVLIYPCKGSNVNVFKCVCNGTDECTPGGGTDPCNLGNCAQGGQQCGQLPTYNPDGTLQCGPLKGQLTLRLSCSTPIRPGAMLPAAEERRPNRNQGM